MSMDWVTFRWEEKEKPHPALFWGFPLFYGISGFPASLIFVPIALLISSKCCEWAVEIKKSKNIAYVIGFIFSLFGLLGYWLYYTRHKTNV